MLSDEQIKKYQTLHKNRFGEEISREQAYERGVKLLRILEVIYKTMTKTELQNLQKRRKETGDLKHNITKQ